MSQQRLLLSILQNPSSNVSISNIDSDYQPVITAVHSGPLTGRCFKLLGVPESSGSVMSSDTSSIIVQLTLTNTCILVSP